MKITMGMSKGGRKNELLPRSSNGIMGITATKSGHPPIVGNMYQIVVAVATNPSVTSAYCGDDM